MSAFALRACVLLYIDARPGEWIAIERIRAHLGTSVERVQHCCTQLVEANQLQHATAGGTAFYGVRCEGQPVPGATP